MVKRTAGISMLLALLAIGAWGAAPPSDLPLTLPGPESTPMPPPEPVSVASPWETMRIASWTSWIGHS